MKKILVDIDRLALEGDGVGRTNGLVAFVPYSLPGEKIEGQVLEEKKNYLRIIPQKIIQPAKERIVPRCEVHFSVNKSGRWCGGCDWQQVRVADQRDYKRGLVKETLERLGGLVNPSVEKTESVGDGWRYRNKVQVPFGERDGKIVSGFYAPNSHDIVPFQDCLVQPEVSVGLVKFIENYAQTNRWQAYRDQTHSGWLRHALVRTNRMGAALLVLVTKDASFYGKNEFLSALRKEFPTVVGVHQNVQPARTNVILGHHWIRLWGESILEETMGPLRLQVSPSSFFQVNTEVAEKLCQAAIAAIELDNQTILLDLYCGVGGFTLLGAPLAKFAVGVEMASSSIRDAKVNAKLNRIANVEFLEMKAEEVFRSERYRWIFQDPKKLVVLVDPPRSGCEKELLLRLLGVKPRKIVYVSCNPATLARDLKILAGSYRLSQAVPYDLFPQTSHIETLAVLEKI